VTGYSYFPCDMGRRSDHSDGVWGYYMVEVWAVLDIKKRLISSI